jgi:hypothetical protein
MVALAVFAAACGDDGTSGTEASNGTTSTTDGEEALVGPRDDNPWNSTQPAIDLCEAVAARDGAAVAARMSSESLATDRHKGEVFMGPEAIQAWIDNGELFQDFEHMTCTDEGVAANWWSGVTFTMHSDTTPGGIEGILFAQPRDGEDRSLQLFYRPTQGEPESQEPVSADDQAVVAAWCEAWGTLDAEEVKALAVEDLVLTGRNPTRPRVGGEGIENGVFMLQEDPEDTMECPQQYLGAAGVIASPYQWVDTDDPDFAGRSWGGIWVVEIDDEGRVSEASFLAQTMTVDGVIYDVSQDPETGEITNFDPEVFEGG